MLSIKHSTHTRRKPNFSLRHQIPHVLYSFWHNMHVDQNLGSAPGGWADIRGINTVYY